MLAAGANVNVDLLRVTAFAVVIALFTFAVSQLTFTNPTRELRVLVKLSEIGPTSQYNPDNWHEFLVDLISELYEVRSLSRYHCLLLLDWINTKDIDPSDLKQLAFNLRALLYPMPPHQFGKVLYRFRKERRILYK